MAQYDRAEWKLSEYVFMMSVVEIAQVDGPLSKRQWFPSLMFLIFLFLFITCFVIYISVKILIFVIFRRRFHIWHFKLIFTTFHGDFILILFWLFILIHNELESLGEDSFIFRFVSVKLPSFKKSVTIIEDFFLYNI